MTDYKPQRFNKVLRELNISLDRAVEFLANKGIDIDHRPTAKISQDVYTILSDEFQTDKSKKVASKEIGEEKRKEKEEIRLALEKEADVMGAKAAKIGNDNEKSLAQLQSKIDNSDQVSQLIAFDNQCPE